ncbi:MAG: hypothetical protein HC876_23345 [Chloroflexaceae bacterium]|nr:hypothetical protein [Chloroflexaceae bacterium]
MAPEQYGYFSLFPQNKAIVKAKRNSGVKKALPANIALYPDALARPGNWGESGSQTAARSCHWQRSCRRAAWQPHSTTRGARIRSVLAWVSLEPRLDLSNLPAAPVKAGVGQVSGHDLCENLSKKYTVNKEIRYTKGVLRDIS